VAKAFFQVKIFSIVLNMLSGEAEAQNNLHFSGKPV